jgi:hypothetical protein
VTVVSVVYFILIVVDYNVVVVVVDVVFQVLTARLAAVHRR